jgi:hypothetical protein
MENAAAVAVSAKIQFGERLCGNLTGKICAPCP